MIIKVTQDHIDAGCKMNIKWCPINRAIRDAVGGDVTVDIVSIDVFPIGECIGVSVPTPKIVGTFLENFDNSKKVEPFEFEIELEAGE